MLVALRLAGRGASTAGLFYSLSECFLKYWIICRCYESVSRAIDYCIRKTIIHERLPQGRHKKVFWSGRRPNEFNPPNSTMEPIAVLLIFASHLKEFKLHRVAATEEIRCFGNGVVEIKNAL